MANNIPRKVKVGEIVKIKGKYYKVCKDRLPVSCSDCAFWNAPWCSIDFSCSQNVHFVKCAAPKTKPKSKVSSTQKQLEEALCALRVINTWATFHGGRELNPTHVANLTSKTLDAIANMQEKDSK